MIEENPHLLGVVGRFGLSFGFADKTVMTVCAEDNVDMESFLAVCNLLCGRNCSVSGISLPALMGYLGKAHVHFTDFLLPSIRKKLIDAINCSDINDITFLLLRFFDDYVQEVRNHMRYENDEVFAYVSKLLEGDTSGNFRIADYSLNHVSMTEKLNGLKDIFIRHYHVRDNEILTSALLDIIYCGNELERHCEIENRLFVPAVEKLENSLEIDVAARTEKSDMETGNDGNGMLRVVTEREKEVLCCVAKGMSNKEIASCLNLSIHTITTYRRNISSKLQIHSAAGLTIFAILNNLIDIKEVDPHISS